MAPQPQIVARLNVMSPDLFRLVFRYVNRGPTGVSGRVSVREEGKSAACAGCECRAAAHHTPLPVPLHPHTSIPPCLAALAYAWAGRPVCWFWASAAWGGLWAVSCLTVPTPRC